MSDPSDAWLPSTGVVWTVLHEARDLAELARLWAELEMLRARYLVLRTPL